MARSSLFSLFRRVGALLLAASCLAMVGLASALAQQAATETTRDDYVLGAGDAIRIQVFQSPELTVDARVSEAGVISYPLLGPVRIGGMSSTDIEKLIAQRLRDGKFLQSPQVTVNITTFRSQQVSVLGNVTRPGRYPLETTGMRLSEVLSLAGGVTPAGADEVVLVTTRDGKETRIDIDMVDMFASGNRSKDPPMQAGDVIYVSRAPQYYIYGQVQRPGMYGVDRGMTVAQAIAKGGGLTLRGTDKGVRVNRRKSDGKLEPIEPKLDDPIRPDDLIFIRESIF
jgi:polysaccharide export outer membrane protein